MSQRAYVSVTVLLELEWVLRGFYALTRSQNVAVFRALAGLEHITLEDRPATLLAMDAYEAGLDFADACTRREAHAQRLSLPLTEIREVG